MIQPRRKYSATSSYRYGFNGKEKSQEINEDNYDFGNRIHDGRIGRWLSVDPLQAKYPTFSPFAFVANSPLNAVDPDGRLIIFINGLWGAPMTIGPGGTEAYWGKDWVKLAQDVIGDHKPPKYYDGSFGGTGNLKMNMDPITRMKVGYLAGYRDAKSIIDNLDKDETIKIITNSMGAAFERGFTFGLLEYQKEENKRRAEFNAKIDKILDPLYQQKESMEEFKKAIPEANMTDPKKFNKELADLNTKISELESKKKQMLNVEIEMVIDLSSHQIGFADPAATSSYYMTAGKQNMNAWERTFVDEKPISSATSLGTMSVHHSSGADPNKFPSAKKRN